MMTLTTIEHWIGIFSVITAATLLWSRGKVADAKTALLILLLVLGAAFIIHSAVLFYITALEQSHNAAVRQIPDLAIWGFGYVVGLTSCLLAIFLQRDTVRKYPLSRAHQLPFLLLFVVGLSIIVGSSIAYLLQTHEPPTAEKPHDQESETPQWVYEADLS